MPRVGFESTIPVFERAKTVHALDRAATVIGHTCILKRVMQHVSANERLSLEHHRLFGFCVFSDDTLYPHSEPTERRPRDMGITALKASPFLATLVLSSIPLCPVRTSQNRLSLAKFLTWMSLPTFL
jgi:hypothetical protein